MAGLAAPDEMAWPPEPAPGELLVGLDDGDDAAVVRLASGTAIVATAERRLYGNIILKMGVIKPS